MELSEGVSRSICDCRRGCQAHPFKQLFASVALEGRCSAFETPSTSLRSNEVLHHQGDVFQTLIGYDDLDIAKYFDLTTVRQPMDQVGAKSVEALLAEIEGKRKNPKQVTVKPELVERGSVQPV